MEHWLWPFSELYHACWGANDTDFVPVDANIRAVAHAVWGQRLKIRKWRHPEIQAKPIMLSGSSWDPGVPTSFSCHEVSVSRENSCPFSGQLGLKPAVASRCQEPEAHPLVSPIPKPEVSNFIEFMNNLRDLLKTRCPRLYLQRI